MQKNFPKAWKDKGGLWSFRGAVAVRLLWLSMSTQRGGLFRPFRFGSCLRSVFKYWPQVSEAASALAVAVSAKPLQHQASCFRLSKLLWLVLTLFRLLTLKLRHILSQFLYIAGRDGLFAKIGIGWGGLKRQGKDFGFLVESTNGLNLRDDYPQILGDSAKALIWRQSWLLNMCFFCPLLRSIKKNQRTSNQRVGMSSP